eukprot:730573-Rhodomonas_salina.2
MADSAATIHEMRYARDMSAYPRSSMGGRTCFAETLDHLRTWAHSASDWLVSAVKCLWIVRTARHRCSASRSACRCPLNSSGARPVGPDRRPQIFGWRAQSIANATIAAYRSNGSVMLCR